VTIASFACLKAIKSDHVTEVSPKLTIALSASKEGAREYKCSLHTIRPQQLTFDCRTMLRTQKYHQSDMTSLEIQHKKVCQLTNNFKSYQQHAIDVVNVTMFPVTVVLGILVHAILWHIEDSGFIHIIPGVQV
jgi:hypothetical protein